MFDPNISEGDNFSYNEFRNYVPPSTGITYTQITNIYEYCKDVKKVGIQKSDVYTSISNLSFGIVSVTTYLGNKYLVFLFALAALIFYIKWVLARKEEVYSIKQFADNIIRQMPLSEEETIRAKKPANKSQELFSRFLYFS